MTYEYKGYKIAGSGGYAMKVIQPIGKGSVPKELRGLYTSSPEAELAIDRLEASKGKTRAKTSSAD